MTDAKDNTLMGLQGQQGRRRGDAGYAMAALLVMIGVMAVVMAAVMPVWRHEAQREKEEEYVFRSRQYARAIGLYFRRFQTYPASFDVLVSQRFLRKKYKDPLTNQDFEPMFLAAQAGRQGGPPGVGAGGIIGVRSKSKETSIRVLKGATHYNEWAVTYADIRLPGVNPGGGLQQPGAGRNPAGRGTPGTGPGGQFPGAPFPGGRNPGTGFPGGPGTGPGRGGRGGRGGPGGA